MAWLKNRHNYAQQRLLRKLLCNERNVCHGLNLIFLLRIVKLKVAKKPDMRNEELVPSERGNE